MSEPATVAPIALRALILAPVGRDAGIASLLLREAGIEPVVLGGIPALCRALDDGAGLAVITEEAVRSADVRPLAGWIAAQPPWSDLPVVLLTAHGGGPERNPAASRYWEMLGNVTFLERPFHPTTFVSVALAALKGRRRQYEARARLQALRDSEARLSTALQEVTRLNETLEQRVRERTGELEQAHAQLVRQVSERERAESQLRQVQKMETIGQLTGGVAHDFNNLLMAVIGNLQLLRKRLPPEPRFDRLIEGAMQGAQRGASLTQRLLAFARRQDLTIKPVELVALVRGMTELLQRSMGPGIDLRLELPERLPAVEADANQIELALLNLAVNGRDAMPEGGTLTVSLGENRVGEGNSDGLQPGRYACLSVMDTGTGMDAKTLERSIEPFFSTKELGKGTGLGLSMIHGLAIQLKGGLRLSSRLGAGTTATLWLPLAGRAAEPSAPAETPLAPAPAVARLTILLVDDDVLIAMSTVGMLEDLGHQVIEAHSGSEALAVVQDGKPFDLLITDYAMPGMTGLQLARAVRRLRPQLPILLATGYAELPQGAETDLPRLGKPYDQDRLAAQIARLVPPATPH